ncbi:glutamine amidotransferase [Halobacteria archaeon AArc-curdl1]|uniref:Glutamine amidotransferase n=1 Tax=Natronosalvus hydrolyticus TaxID=2979988 RepID=A0AAP2Z5P6_9EURY|nr:glutamine amidotransferase [Halobacteria archaeon AArc-curdl1]
MGAENRESDGNDGPRVLLAGESWQTLSFEIKGRNVLTDSTYEEAGDHLIAALQIAGATVDFQPCHVAETAFPRTREALDVYDLVILSDIGADTLQITPRVAAGETDADRCRLLESYVHDGGAVGMIGGYMSFAGVGGQARYAHTALSNVLPVHISSHDDRIEVPGGIAPLRTGGPTSIPDEWPSILGYNRLEAKSGADVWAAVENDPLLVVGEHGNGHAFAFATDCAPHWAPLEFLEWERLPDVWEAVLDRVVP